MKREERYSGYVYKFIVLICRMLKESRGYLSMDDVEKEALQEIGKVYAAKAPVKAKSKISEVLKRHGFSFDEIKDVNDRRKCLFRYPDGIDFDPLDELCSELKRFKLDKLLSIINDSSGIFPKSWLANFKIQINSQYESNNHGNIIQFDYRQLRNIELIPSLYESIKMREVIRFSYKTYTKKEFRVTFSPALLKEYNNRWFVFGMSHWGNEDSRHSVYAIDRIVGDYECCDLNYINSTVDYSTCFQNIVGVSMLDMEIQGNPPDDIIISVEDEKTIGYIETRPLHPSQQIDNGVVTLKCHVNYELVVRLLEYADCMKIIKPDSLRLQILERAKKIVEMQRQ